MTVTEHIRAGRPGTTVFWAPGGSGELGLPFRKAIACDTQGVGVTETDTSCFLPGGNSVTDRAAAALPTSPCTKVGQQKRVALQVSVSRPGDEAVSSLSRTGPSTRAVWEGA